MDIDCKQINFYTLLGVAMQAPVDKLKNTIEQHVQAKLLPLPILDAAKAYLLNETVRLQYDFALQNQPLTAVHLTIEQLDVYQRLQLSPLALPQDIAQTLQSKWGVLALQEWLLMRKWLLNRSLRQRYDAYWLENFHAPAASETMPTANEHVPSVGEVTASGNAWWLYGICAATVIASALSLPYWQPKVPPSVLKKEVLPKVPLYLAQSLQKTTITITAAGDTTLGSHLGQQESNSLPHFWQQYGSSYFLDNVREVFAHDDLSIVNLEGPLTYADIPIYKQFAFKGEPLLAEVLTQGSIEAVNVANNHSHDYGKRGFEETLQTLHKQGIKPFGYDHYQVFEVKGKRIGLAGAKGWDEVDGKYAVDQALAFFKRQQIDYYIMSFHWGDERAYQQNQTQQALGRYAIEQGFNVVLGHHPHVVQGIEHYQNGIIVYSLANFVFGGNRNPSDKDALAVQLQLDFIGEKLVATDVLPVPLTVSDTNQAHNYQPVWADTAAQERVRAKMQPHSNIDIALGVRLDHELRVPKPLPQMAQGQFWCDDSLSVRATLFGDSQERFTKCQPRQTPAYWG